MGAQAQAAAAAQAAVLIDGQKRPGAGQPGKRAVGPNETFKGNPDLNPNGEGNSRHSWFSQVVNNHTSRNKEIEDRARRTGRWGDGTPYSAPPTTLLGGGE